MNKEKKRKRKHRQEGKEGEEAALVGHDRGMPKHEENTLRKQQKKNRASQGPSGGSPLKQKAQFMGAAGRNSRDESSKNEGERAKKLQQQQQQESSRIGRPAQATGNDKKNEKKQHHQQERRKKGKTEKHSAVRSTDGVVSF